MGSVPNHAAVKTSSAIAQKLGKEGAVGFINGVLRNVARDKEKFSIPENISKVKRMSIEYSFPEWLIKKWIQELGKRDALALISYNKKNSIALHANSLKGMNNTKLEDTLKALNIKYEKSAFVEDVYKINGNIINTPMFEKGEIAIQGEASYLAAKVAIENKPKKVLDLCTAPGGKTAAMAHIHHDAIYTACDVRQNRVDITKKQFDRLGVTAELYTMDATVKNNDIGLFDTVLCDVPCSALGTVFNHPEVKYNKTFEQIKQIKSLQKGILENASSYVGENGHLVYSTCTISKQENHDMVASFIKEHDEFSAVFPETFRGIINDKRFDGCGVQLLPHIDDTAGFYIACLKRIK